TLFLRYRDQHDLTALAQVFDRTAPQLFALARRLSGRGAEDLVQETFLAVIEKSAAWDDRKPLVPWLLGILTHRAQRVWAKEGRRIDSGRLVVREVEQPDEALAASELHAQVEHALKDLTPALQQAVRGSLFDGKSPTQLAVDLGLDSGTIRQRLFRGMSQLRLQLKGAVLLLFALFGLRSQGLAGVRRQVLREAATASGVGVVGLAAVSLPGRVVVAAVAVSLCWVGVDVLWPSGDAEIDGTDDTELVGLRPEVGVDSGEAPGLAAVTDSRPRRIRAMPLEFAVQLVWDETGEAIVGREVSVALKSGESTKCISGANGEASFSYSRADVPWRLSANSAPDGLGVSLFIGGDDPKELRIVRFSKGGSLSGTVEDSEGNPVPNATILGWSNYTKGMGPDREAQTDGNGQFTVQHLGKRFKLTASSADLVCWKGLCGALPAGKALVDHKIELTEPVDYLGRVLSPQGASIEGANVETTDLAGASNRQGITHDSSVKSFLAGEGSTITDEQGRFVLSGLPPGERPMSVRRKPYLILREDEVSNAEPIEFTLDPGGLVEGNVRGRNGEIVPDVQISYWPHRKWSMTTPEWIVPDPETGRFVIRGIEHHEGFQQDPSERNRGVLFRAPGYGVKMVTPLPDDLSELSPLVVRMNPEQRIEGRVVDSKGHPQAGLRVRVEGEETYESNMHDGLPNTWEKLIEKNVVHTNAKGEFSFGELYSGEFIVRAYSGIGEQGSVFKRIQSGGDPVELVMDKELLRGVVILPTVTDELTGKLIEDFSLLQWVDGHGRGKKTTIGAHGPEVVGLDPGIWGLGIRADGYVSERLPDETFVRGEHRVSLQLCPLVRLEVRVERPDGTAAEYVTVKGLDSDGSDLWFEEGGGQSSSSTYLSSSRTHLKWLPARQVELSFYTQRCEATVSIDLAKPLPSPLVVHLRPRVPKGLEPVTAHIAVWELIPFDPKEGVPSGSFTQPRALDDLSQEEALAFFKSLGYTWFEEPSNPFSVSVDGPTGEGVLTMEFEYLEADDPELVKWRTRQLRRDLARQESQSHEVTVSQPRNLSGGQLRLTVRSSDIDGWISAVSYPLINRPQDGDEDTVTALEASFQTVPGECRLRLTSDYYESIELTWHPGQRQKGDSIPVLLLVPKKK
ncbi:MAG: sigma-70 family RNA polymerase sigma factor, partial [bacterium]|nr:sigma-70 family RNA polymerase sigma factor [bacterium]